MKRLVAILFFGCLTLVSYAVTATPEPVLRTLPDGSVAMVRLHGDEHRSWLTRLDGTLIPGTMIAEEESAPYDFVADAAQESSASTLRKAPAQAMIGGYVPSSGKVYIPVILLNFSDLSFSIDDPVTKFTDLFNGNGGSNPNATGSVHTYYDASSNGTLDLTYEVYGPYTLSKAQEYYGANSGNSHNKNIRELILEAARLAVAAGVSLSKYDNDGDGYIDNLSVVVAGYNEAEGGDENTIWPHYSNVNSSETFSGLKVRGYLAISEYKSSGGSIQCGIGTYCHEFGHALGLPDLYNTTVSDDYTVGEWDIMCNGNYCNNGCTPPTFTAFERYVFGWITPVQLTTPNNYVLEPIETSNTAYLVANGTFSGGAKSSMEYFLLENRQKVGWDAGKEALVGAGMLVSHITFNSSNWTNNTFNNDTPLGFDVVEAQIKDPTSATASDVFPGAGKITTWLPTLNDGTTLDDQVLMNITQQTSGAVSFHYGVNSDDGFFFSPTELPQLTTTYDNGQAIAYDTAALTVTVKNITSDSIALSSTSSYFDFSLDGGNTWVQRGNTYYLSAQKGITYDIPLLIRHAPQRQSCDTKTGYLKAETTDGNYINQIQLTGISPRPTYISTPVMTGYTSVSTTSFLVEWEAQEDAEVYYLTAYSEKDNPSTQEEDFEEFSSSELIAEAGWSSNFTDQTTNVSASGKAMYFTTTGQTLRSVKYVAAPTEISFWISNNYVTSSSDSLTGGQLLLEGSADGETWKQIDNLRVLRTTKNVTKDYTLSADDAFLYFRFTYTHLGGTGGLGLDDFTATLDREIDYVCQGRERELTTNRAILTNLTAGTTYYCAVQAYENKGCEEHLTALSEPISVTTLTDGNTEQRLEVTREEDGTYYAELPQPSDGTTIIYVFAYDGRMMGSVSVPYGDYKVQIPTDDLLPNNLYILKAVDVRMKRKGAKAKMLFY